jgi:methylated-DNA-[protein]-cysteine S-methyltransferase
METRHATIETAELGELTLVATGPALSGIYYANHSTNPDRSTFGDEVDAAADPVLADAAGQLRAYLRGDRQAFDLPTVARGSAFDQRVWELLRALPFGETTTYGELAETLGDRTLARKVGGAVGRNPLSIVVGCHRVVGSDGDLRGYAGGLDRKRFLLDLEAGRTSLVG